MKGIVKIVCLTLGLILLFTAGFLAGVHALASAPTAAKAYAVDRFTDEALFVKKEESPTPQLELQEKFETYNKIESIEPDPDSGKEAGTRLTFFTEEQAEERRSRKENGELFTLSYDEVLFIINDSIQQYYRYDEIVLTDDCMTYVNPPRHSSSPGYYQRTPRTVSCYHGDFSEFDYETAADNYNRVLSDIFRIITYRLSMLDSSFALYGDEPNDLWDMWKRVSIKPSGLDEDGRLDRRFTTFDDRNEEGFLLVSEETLLRFSFMDSYPCVRTFYLKSFAEADSLASIREKTVEEYCVYANKKLASVVTVDSEEAEKWKNASLDAPLLLTDFEDGHALILISEPDGLTLSVVFPTAELKEKAPVCPSDYHPLGYHTEEEYNKRFSRSFSEIMVKELMPDYDLSNPTPVYPLKVYHYGVKNDGNGLKLGMSFTEMVAQFGVPYDGDTSGFLSVRYFTAEGNRITIYVFPHYDENHNVDDYSIAFACSKEPIWKDIPWSE